MQMDLPPTLWTKKAMFASSSSSSPLLLGFLLASRCTAVDPPSLNLTALSASNGMTTIECWQVGPFVSSNDAGTSGVPSYFFGDVVNATYSVIPPNFDGGLHNAPSFQFVFFAAGSARITLPNGTEEATVGLGKNRLIIAGDTADVSTLGHRTQYLGGDKTVAMQVPIKDPKNFNHTVLHNVQMNNNSNVKHPNDVNPSGHAQELPRRFSLLSLAGTGLLVGNVWPAIGGSLAVAISNGGPPGVLYEFVAVSVCYLAVAASIAELASAVPSSAGVYHWASVAAGVRAGRPVGFLAGWWNYLAWVLGAASMTSILGNAVVQMHASTHAGFKAEAWHVLVVYLVCTWAACLVVCVAARAMPALNKLGGYAIVVFFVVTVVIVAVMPALPGHDGHATSESVWTEWKTLMAYPPGFVFLSGMLNGAYSVGAVDAITHLAEEIPSPERNVPLALALQVSIGSVTGVCYLVAILYAIHDLDALRNSPYPIADIYRQATGSQAAVAGLLFMIVVCIGLTVLGLHITCGRTLWTLARDGASPFSATLSGMNKSLQVPVNATVASAVLVTILGILYVGSTAAFNVLVGSFVVLSSSSYVACILPHILTRRSNMTYGPFRMSGIWGYIVNAFACLHMIVWGVVYCFPSNLPTDAKSMNYTGVIWGGSTVVIILFWLLRAKRGYRGPKLTTMNNEVVYT
ncbi:hypothetical protein L249_3153 [Ophiocordyceps polyrhachis-furcata BCC 54312]|uniref:Amino acid permease/ SLC12A domain-containing protein n=1 Tax=Ophiocordyceps polyrhachis-furcata BCC 54312 TaxID=1330021 RepID=A0A367LS84_9HYPO|nr:hypothetical protein L249_3153 [Ophiocordyceps polyrhachis-furcata BCC 54312]